MSSNLDSDYSLRLDDSPSEDMSQQLLYTQRSSRSFSEFPMKSTRFLSYSNSFNPSQISRLRRKHQPMIDPSRCQTPKPVTLSCRSFSFKHSTDIDSRMNRRVLNEDQDIKIQIYSKLFGEIITQDTNYGPILTQVKNSYDSYISYLKNQGSTESEIETYKQEIADIKLQLKKNYLKTKLYIAKHNKEIQNFKTIKQTMKKEIRILRSREEKYVSLLSTLCEQGYPVKEVYNELIKENPSISQQETYLMETYRHVTNQIQTIHSEQDENPDTVRFI